MNADHMNADKLIALLTAMRTRCEIDGADPVVLVSAYRADKPHSEPVVDAQPCMWNPKTGDACSRDDVDLDDGYVKAVAILAKGSS